MCHWLLVMHCFHCDQAQTCVKVGASFSSLVTGCSHSQVLLSLVSACESTLPLCISNFNIATLSLLVPICQSPKLYEMGTAVNLIPPPPTPEKIHLSDLGNYCIFSVKRRTIFFLKLSISVKNYL